MLIEKGRESVVCGGGPSNKKVVSVCVNEKRAE